MRDRDELLALLNEAIAECQDERREIHARADAEGLTQQERSLEVAISVINFQVTYIELLSEFVGFVDSEDEAPNLRLITDDDLA